MAGPFIGREAIAAQLTTRVQLASRHTRVFPGVYVDSDIELTAADRAHAAWLWSGRRAVVGGFSAAALHGSAWVGPDRPAELIHDNRHRLPGLLIRGDRVRPAEIVEVDGIRVTGAARTAVDLACWYPTAQAVPGIDALGRAVKINDAEVREILRKSGGRRGIVRARASLALIDTGAESPQESRLRTVLVRAGLPRPQTQIPVYDGYWKPFAVLDMGWPDLKVGVEYDGDVHRSDPARWRRDVKRHERLQRCGWIVIRVVAGDRDADVISRVRSALARRA